MALPLSMADGGPSPVPPAGASPDAGGLPPGDIASEGDGGWTVCCTILKNDQGQFKLITGDEPEPGADGAAPDMGAAEGQVFDGGPALLRAVMGEIESDAGAEKSFGDAFAGKSKGAMPPAAGGI